MPFGTVSVFRFPGNTDFIIIKHCKIDETDYQPGDTLSPSASVRKMPRRLEVLCRHRYIAPRSHVATTIAKPEKEKLPKPAMAEAEVSDPLPAKKKKKKLKAVKKKDYESMTKPELRAILRKRGLRFRGKRVELIARLESSDNDE